MVLSLSAVFLIFGSAGAAKALCSLPYQIANGQIADAVPIMADLNQITSCLNNTAVTFSGSPVVGSISIFTAVNSITSGDLTGDVTTNGSTVTTLSDSGVTSVTYASANITVDSKGRITSASNGESGGNEWVNLTFATPPSTVWGQSFLKADQNAVLTDGNRIDIVIGFKHNAGNQIAIAIFPDGQTSYLTTQQSDNNFVLYRNSSASGSSFLLSGGSLVYAFSGTMELSLTVWVGASNSSNAIMSTRFGESTVKLADDPYADVPLIGNNIGIYISPDSDALSNISYAKFRVQ